SSFHELATALLRRRYRRRSSLERPAPIAARPRLPLTNPEEEQGQYHAHEEDRDEGGRSEDAKATVRLPEQPAEPDGEARLPLVFAAVSKVRGTASRPSSTYGIVGLGRTHSEPVSRNLSFGSHPPVQTGAAAIQRNLGASGVPRLVDKRR